MFGDVLEGGLEELVELVASQVVVLDHLPLFSVGVVRSDVAHAVGRVGEDHVRLLAVHQSGHVVGVGGVSAHENVVSELEDVACLGDWRDVRCLFVEVVFLCLWFLMLVVDVLPHVHTPVVEVLGIPFVGQQIVVPFAELGIIEDEDGVDVVL